MRTAFLLLTLLAAACGGNDHTASTTTNPTGTLPTMNDTAGESQPPGDAAAVAASGTFDRYDNSGFAGTKTDSISPLAQSSNPPAAPAPTGQTTTAAAARAHGNAPPAAPTTTAPGH